MSCRDKDKDLNCVCEAVLNIADLQDAVEDDCPTSCFSNLLAPTQFVGDTIPFLLYTKKGDLFKAFGNVGELLPGDCFKTPFFRVEHVRRDCCATLSLLRPVNAHGTVDCATDVCDVDNLVRTDFCIEVDLSCFCAIQCLDPRLVVRNFVADIDDDDDKVSDVEEDADDRGRRRHRH